MSDAPAPPPAAQHALKRVHVFARDVAIALQADNGPCPLLSIVNALALRGDAVRLPLGAGSKRARLLPAP